MKVGVEDEEQWNRAQVTVGYAGCVGREAEGIHLAKRLKKID